MNILPWGGPTARAMTTLKMDASELFVPMIPVMLGGVIWVLFAAFWLGMKEKRKISKLAISPQHFENIETENTQRQLRRPALIWFNLLLTLCLLTSMMLNIIPLGISFMIGFCIALIINTKENESCIFNRHKSAADYQRSSSAYTLRQPGAHQVIPFGIESPGRLDSEREIFRP